MFYAAAKEAADGPNWASKLCSASRSFSLCHDPQQVAFIAAGLAALWLVVMFVSAIRIFRAALQKRIAAFGNASEVSRVV
jgi:hypothetical protein